MAASYLMRQHLDVQPRVAELLRSLGLEPASGI
jgi:hypothetical protein